MSHPHASLIYQDKRKASMDNIMQQPSLKRVATEGSMGVNTASSFPVNIQRATGGYSTSLGGSDVGLSSMSRNLPTENLLGINGRKDDRAKKPSSSSTQALKEVMDLGQMLPLLTESFGENMLPFIPTPLSNIFLWGSGNYSHRYMEYKEWTNYSSIFGV